MLNKFKSLLKSRLYKPEKPSEELLNHYWAELAMLEQDAHEPPTDPRELVPVPKSALIRDGEYFGAPINSFWVVPEKIITFLEVHRDQSLWFATITALNYDYSTTNKILEWILRQPDCDALNAARAFDFLDGCRATRLVQSESPL